MIGYSINLVPRRSVKKTGFDKFGIGKLMSGENSEDGEDGGDDGRCIFGHRAMGCGRDRGGQHYLATSQEPPR